MTFKIPELEINIYKFLVILEVKVTRNLSTSVSE